MILPNTCSTCKLKKEVWKKSEKNDPHSTFYRLPNSSTCDILRSFVTQMLFSARSFLPVIPILLVSLLKAETLEGVCTDVTDGDTLTLVLANDSTEKIRLYGIDAPEKQQDYANEAQQRLAELTMGKQLRADVQNRDRYGRAVAKVYVGETDICRTLVQEGCAWHYVMYAPLDMELAEAETAAELHQSGLWQHPHPVPPWEFRKGARPAVPNEHNLPFWITESGKVHNARCKYFGITQKGHYSDSVSESHKDCNLCGGADGHTAPAFPTWWNTILIVLLLGILPLVLLRLLIVRPGTGK